MGIPLSLNLFRDFCMTIILRAQDSINPEGGITQEVQPDVLRAKMRAFDIELFRPIIGSAIHIESLRGPRSGAGFAGKESR
jgi:hypothetical protein